MRYFKILLALINHSTKFYLEHRWNAFGYYINGILSLGVTLVFINIIYSHTNGLNDWSKFQVIFLVGAFQFISYSFAAFFLKNINLLPEYIQKGTLDIFLTKPVDSQFYLSFQTVRLHQFFNALTGILVIVYAISNMKLHLSLLNWILLVASSILGMVVLYSIYFIIATLSFWFVKFTALPDLWNVLTRPLTLPIDIYGRIISFIFTFIIPLVFVVTVPSGLFFGKFSNWFVLWEVLVAILLLALSIWFWNFALKHYTSASS